MKKIARWLITVTLLFSMPAIGWPQSGNTQLQESVNAIKKQITDLEKEIANDKAIKADPRKIQRKEERLVMIKSTLAMMEGNTPVTTGSADQTEGIFKKKYKSPLTPVLLKRPVTPPAAAEARNRFMSFWGKKIDDTTLITKEGKLVRLNKKEKKLIIQPEKSGDRFLKVVDEIINTKERMESMLTRMDDGKSGFFYYPELLKACLEYDLSAEFYGELIANTMELGSVPDVATIQRMERNGIGGHSVGYETPVFDTLPNNANLERLFTRLENLLNRAPAVDQFPAPPLKEFDLCFACDTTALRLFYRKLRTWHQDFDKYEVELLQLSFGIEHGLAILGISGESISENKRQLLDKAKEKGLSRLVEKANILTQRYIGNAKTHQAVMSKLLGIERQHQLFGAENVTPATARIPDFHRIFEEHIRGEMQRKNYPVVLNLSLILGHERELQLLGASDQQVLLKDVLKFNRFTVDLTVDFSIERYLGAQTPQSGENGVINTDNPKDPSRKVYLSLGQLGCKWQMFLTGQNYQEPSKTTDLFIPLKAAQGTAWIIAKGERKEYQYTGPERAYSSLPLLRIDFCKDGNPDSAQLDLLNYDPDLLSTYLKHVPTQAEYYGLQFIPSANLLLHDLSKAKSNSEKIKDLAIKVLSTAVDIVPTGLPLLDNLQKAYKGKLKSMEYQRQLTEMSKRNKVYMLFDASNMSPLLVNNKSTVDTYDQVDKKNVKGSVLLKIEHSPQND